MLRFDQGCFEMGATEGVTVRTLDDIPIGIAVGLFPGELSLGKTSEDTRTITDTIEINYEEGNFTLQGEKTSAWLWLVQPARDRHEQNLEAVRDTSLGFIFYKSIKEIKKDEELLVWYGDELARESNIPVLTPEQIRGKQQYTCTKCMKSYLYPNTLKAHMKFHCPQNDHVGFPAVPRMLLPGTPSLLGMKMPHLPQPLPMTFKNGLLPRNPKFLDLKPGAFSAFKPSINFTESVEKRESPSGKTPTDRNSPHELKLKPSQKPDLSPITSTSSHQPIQIFNHIYPPALPMSLDTYALHNYLPLYRRLCATQAACCEPVSPYANYLMSACHPERTIHPSPVLDLERSSIDTRPMSFIDNSPTASKIPEPTLERDPSGNSTFPNVPEKSREPLDMLPRSLYMSKSRKGHLCIYCGKLYSRKYGLKIHLRTHTGYKPLKCKVCLRPFGDPSNLNKHIRLHAEGDTPYRCEFCGKVLVRRRDLERHIKSRHPGQLSLSKEVETKETSPSLTGETLIETIDETIDDAIEGTTDELMDESDSESKEIEVV